MPTEFENLDERELKRRFAISPHMDLEIDAGGDGWVGLTAEAPHDLRQNVTASVLALKLGYTSVDYVRKKYLKDMKQHIPRDERLRELVQQHTLAYDAFYRAFESRTGSRLGVFAFDLAMVRARVSLDLMVALARQGFLIETSLVARSLLEQFAYAVYVWDKTDDEHVFQVQPQNLIGHLRVVSASSGRAYGQLSKLAHYNPKDHFHFIGDPDGSTVTQRSWKFKIVASAWAFYILHMKYLVFEKCYGSVPNFSLVESLRDSSLAAFNVHFSGVDNHWVKEVRALFSEYTTRE